MQTIIHRLWPYRTSEWYTATTKNSSILLGGRY